MNRRDFLKNALIVSAGALMPEKLQAQEKKARITFAGDTLLGGYYNSKYGTMLDLVNTIDSIKEKSGLDGVVRHFFKNVIHLFNESDFSVLNLEGPLSQRYDASTIIKKMIPKAIPLRQHEDCLKILDLAGINLVSLANNHMYDFNNEEGLEYTIKNSIVDYIGAGKKEQAYSCKAKKINGIKFAFFGLTNILEPGNMIATENKIGVAGIPEKSNFNSSKCLNYALENIKSATSYYDFVAVMLHAGPIGGPNPNSSQIELSKILIDNGADLVIGSHSHAKQPIKIYDNKTVFYCLGNFIFGGKKGYQSLSTIPIVDFYLNNGNKSIKYQTYDIHPNDGSFVPVLA